MPGTKKPRANAGLKLILRVRAESYGFGAPREIT